MVKNWMLLLLIGLLSGCGEWFERESEPEVRTLDGIKLISPGILAGDDARTFVQESFELSFSARLLLRFEKLNAIKSEIDLTGDKKIQLQITLDPDSEMDDSLNRLKLCPITRPWMMLATWRHAHPFESGQWETPGGDFERSACLEGTRYVPPPAPEPPPEGTRADAPEDSIKSIVFDVTDWYRVYFRDRSINHGWILIHNGPPTTKNTVYGSRSSQFSPRLLYEKIIPAL